MKFYSGQLMYASWKTQYHDLDADYVIILRKVVEYADGKAQFECLTPSGKSYFFEEELENV